MAGSFRHWAFSPKMLPAERKKKEKERKEKKRKNVNERNSKKKWGKKKREKESNKGSMPAVGKSNG